MAMIVPRLYSSIKFLSSPPAIDFGSSQGKQLFREAVQNGNMEGFPRLVSCFETQSELGFCGLTSLSMVLNAFLVDPGRKWKGPWRWCDHFFYPPFHDNETIKNYGGISFANLASLAHCTGAKVEAFYASDSNIDDFRKYVMTSSTSDDCHVIASFPRDAFKQLDGCHYSPIGGYHAGKDMVLVLDVARFKYPPYWIPVTHLWQGMSYGRSSRGFMLISKPPKEHDMLYTMSCKHENWNSIAKFLIDDVPSLLKSEDVKDITKVLSVIVTSLPSIFEEFVNWVAEMRQQDVARPYLSEEQKTRAVMKREVLDQLQSTPLFKHVASFLSHPSSSGKLSCTCSSTTKLIGIHPASAYVLTALLLSLPFKTWWDGITDEKLLVEILMISA